MTADDSTGSDEGQTDRQRLVNVSRRKFMAGSGTLAVGLFLFGGEALADSSVVEGAEGDGESDLTPEMFIKVHADGRVEFVIHRSEMGQQIWTSLAQVLADEMEADWGSIEITQAEGHPRYGDQNTDGSRSIRYNFRRFRFVGAAMRQLLERAAAKQWETTIDACRAESGVVRNDRTGDTAKFGELVNVARDLPMPSRSEVTLKDRDDWDKIARPVKSLIAPSIVKGEGAYGQDLQVDGMKVAVIARPPDVLGSVDSYDDAAALEVPGVEQTVEMPDIDEPVLFQPLGGVAVVADNTWAAMKGREALEIEWASGPNADYDTESFKQTLMETARESGETRRERGHVDEALAEAEQTVEAEYFVPHCAHVAMEPPAALAEWEDDGSVMVWGCTQTPQRARSIVAEHCDVPKEDVTAQVSWLGGGFGRKSKPDYYVEAALVSREVGAPVKVVWTREDAVQHSYYHTISAQRLAGGLDDEGKCTAFEHRTVFPPIASTFDADATSPTWGDLRQGATDTPFDVPNLRVESGEASAHVRTGWLRSVANIYHAFAVQSFVGELAAKAGRDQKDFLLELIGPPREVDPREEGAKYDNYGSSLEDYPIDTGRLAGTVERAADMADWGRDLPERHGLGIAAHRSFVTYAATVIEVAVDEDGTLSIPGCWSVLDAGTVVNPNHVRHQMEGGTIFGLSNALYGEITASEGAIDQENFPDFRVMRMNEAPRRMEVDIIESPAPPGGVGEPPTPPAAPALTNAIYDAVGLRIRELPIFGNDRRDRLPLDA